MAVVSNFFAGANSGEGFRNLFHEIMAPEETYDMILLKGGPGVGKNTFMREVGKTFESVGVDVEYLWCSGDPDSLDGVVIPDIHCAVVDATSPHVMEPKFPAAVDRYVNLGQFYDIAAAKVCCEEIRRRTQEYQKAYARAYHILKAARQVEVEAVRAAQNTVQTEKINRQIEGIVCQELGRRGEEAGKTKRRFLGGITHQGYVWRFDSVEALCPRVYAVQDPFELAGEFFARLHDAAENLGWDTIVCPSAEEMDRIEHLLIPGLGLAFVTTKSGMEYPGKLFRKIRLDALAETDGKAAFQCRMASLLRQEAIGALQEAKAGHDALEAIYNPYVDFDGVRTLAALESGRLLSYLA